MSALPVITVNNQTVGENASIQALVPDRYPTKPLA
jgi:hypothetical protein